MVELSDDDRDGSVGGPGVGYVAPVIQTQPPPETPVFASLDLRERLGRPGDLAMERQREAVRNCSEFWLMIVDLWHTLWIYGTP